MGTNADEAGAMFLSGYNCAQAVLATCGQARGIPRDIAIRVAQAFGGGIGRTGNLCGALTGALMVVGLDSPAVDASDMAAKMRAHDLARAVVDEFQRRHGSLLCRELTGCDLRTPEGSKRFKEIDAHSTICVKLVRASVEIVEQVLAKKEKA